MIQSQKNLANVSYLQYLSVLPANFVTEYCRRFFVYCCENQSLTLTPKNVWVEMSENIIVAQYQSHTTNEMGFFFQLIILKPRVNESRGLQKL